MRHGDKVNNLGRKTAHRKAMLANMASSLILHKRISTTVAKAKALRVYVEPLLTKSKNDSTHSRRTVFSYLKSKEAVTILFKDVSSKIADRPGGYTRIMKTGTRLGDNADMCVIELVDFNENLLAAKSPAKAKSSRRGKKKATASVTTAPAAKPKEDIEAPKAEEKAPEVETKKEETPAAATEAPKAEKKAPEVEAKKEEAPAEKETPKAKKTPEKKEEAPKAPKAEKKEEPKKDDSADKNEKSE